MKRMCMVLIAVVLLSGCAAFRPAATEAQKANAWLHWQTTGLAADAAEDEQTSAALRELTDVAHRQSEAFVIDYGLPREMPAATETEAILAQAPAVAASAREDAARRIDPWAVADGLMEAGIAVAGLLGGAWGLRAVQLLRCAREKSRALKEIVEGNELFKQANGQAVDAFKAAHNSQSPSTRRIVTELRKAA